jgi:hypothetical protein
MDLAMSPVKICTIAAVVALSLGVISCATESEVQAATSESDLTNPSKLPSTALSPQDGSVTGGHCSATVPKPPKQSWRHSKSAATTLLGAPNHRLRDVIALPGQASQLRGRFTYGSVDKDLEDETVELWLQRCPGWQLVGTALTDGEGVAWFNLPANLPAGDYRLRAVVRGDTSYANGMLAVWPKGVKVVVSDVDGTLTTSDWQLFSDLLTQKPAAMYPDGDKAIKAWVAKGYRILYLTGRPQLFNRYTRNWLDTHGLPPGVVRLTDDVGDVVPSEVGVQTFKTQVLKDLMASHGAKIRAGHGNAVTDIGAYKAAGIPTADLYIIGPHGGEQGSTKVDSYTKLISGLAKYPGAAQP